MKTLDVEFSLMDTDEHRLPGYKKGLTGKNKTWLPNQLKAADIDDVLLANVGP